MKNRPLTEMNGADENDERERAADEAADRSAAAEMADSDISELNGQVESAEMPALKELQDRLLYALAEQENIRERSQRELERAVQFAGSDLIADLLDSADNLQLAMKSVPESALADSSFKTFFDGLVATKRALLAAFARHGILPIDPLGQPFNPAFHEAVQVVADEGQGPGIVSAVVRPGYMHHDRLLRPAAVHVTIASKVTSRNDG